MSEPKICIFGTGAVGATYAWVLSRTIPPSNIICICRSNYQAALANGFTINSTIWGNKLNVKPTIVPDITTAATYGPFTHLLVTSKALPTTPPTPSLLNALITPATTSIILLQNGINIEPPFSHLYPTNPLLSVVVYLPATSTSPATISHTEMEHVHIGTYPSTAPSSHQAAAASFTNLLTTSGASATHHPDIQHARWSKLIVNASWNPICALSLSTDAAFLHSSPSSASPASSLSYIRSLMLEISSIAQASGYPTIDTPLADYQLSRATARPLPGVEPSMLADARAGRALEVDAIVGNTVAIAREKGVRTPLLDGVYVMVKAPDKSLRARRERNGSK